MKVLKMIQVPSFFVADAVKGEDEAVYAGLARVFHLQQLPLVQRVFSVVFEHEGITWTAAVGEQLRGIKTFSKKLPGPRGELAHHICDPAIIMAIFFGQAYQVVTSCAEECRSAWPNPFLVYRPLEVTFFSGAAFPQ